MKEQLELCKQELRDLNLKLVEGQGQGQVDGIDVGVSVGGNDVGVGDGRLGSPGGAAAGGSKVSAPPQAPQQAPSQAGGKENTTVQNGTAEGKKGEEVKQGNGCDDCAGRKLKV